MLYSLNWNQPPQTPPLPESIDSVASVLDFDDGSSSESSESPESGSGELSNSKSVEDDAVSTTGHSLSKALSLSLYADEDLFQ